MTKRLEYIDIAKGLCILLVVMGHILQFNCTGNSSQTVFNFIYSFHMPVFVMLSGYVASLSRDKIVNGNAICFIKKKFVQLVIPFLVWGLVVMPFIVRRENYLSLPAIAEKLLLRPDTGAWFIISLFCIQMYFLLFCLLANRMHFRNLICNEGLAAIVVVSLMVVCSKVVNTCVPNASGGVNFYMPKEYLLFFLMGYWFCRYLKDIVFNNWTLLISVLAFAVLVRYYTFGNDPYKLQVICGVFASIIVLNVARAIEKTETVDYSKRTMVKFGKSSLIIYLTHYPIIMLLQNGVQCNTDIVASVPLFIIVAIISILVCAICMYWGNVISTNSIFNFLLYGKYDKK